VANNASAFKDVKSSLGVMQSSYDYWVTRRHTRIIPIFDRVYLPNGMWSTLTTTADGLISGQITAPQAVSQISTSFVSLYRKKA
jgi:raffinose/stachyose/melibiose transport system substrate-binding protein